MIIVLNNITQCGRGGVVEIKAYTHVIMKLFRFVRYIYYNLLNKLSQTCFAMPSHIGFFCLTLCRKTLRKWHYYMYMLYNVWRQYFTLVISPCSWVFNSLNKYNLQYFNKLTRIEGLYLVVDHAKFKSFHVIFPMIQSIQNTFLKIWGGSNADDACLFNIEIKRYKSFLYKIYLFKRFPSHL